MSRSRITVVASMLTFGTAIVVAATSALAGDSQTATPERKAACEKLCDVKDNASCPNSRPVADCVKTCERGAVETPEKCLKKWDAWVTSLGSKPWTCDKQGFPKFASYNAEGGDYAMCMYPSTDTKDSSHPAKAHPQDCAMSSYERYCDSCLMAVCSEQNLACGRNKECRALDECLLSCNPTGSSEQKLACVGKCESKHAAGKEVYQQMNGCITQCSSQCNNARNYSGFGYEDADGKHTERKMLRECVGIFP